MVTILRPLLPLLILLLASFDAQAAAVKTGAQVAAEEGFPLLKGKRFGLVTNATAKVEGRHLLDLLLESRIPPAVIFVPEHGLKGLAEDGVRVPDALEADIPIISLYGERKKPRPGDLAGLDLIVFDIQDIGTRFYTYIATMGLAMETAAEAGIPFVVFDRPNPLGGDYVSGFVRDGGIGAFTAPFPIPIAHGLTVGELALMVKGEAMAPGLDRLDLTVVKMEGWRRSMLWPDTGLAWIPTSPNIPDYETALLYPGIGLLEATAASVGRGTREPFKLAGAPAVGAEKLAASLNGRALPGVRFEPATFVPVAIPGMASNPKFMGRQVAGVRIQITDQSVFGPVETGVAVMAELYNALPEAEKSSFFSKGLDLMAGTNRLQRALEYPPNPGEIQDLWREEVSSFRKTRARYLRYGP